MLVDLGLNLAAIQGLNGPSTSPDEFFKSCGLRPRYFQTGFQNIPAHTLTTGWCSQGPRVTVLEESNPVVPTRQAHAYGLQTRRALPLLKQKATQGKAEKEYW